MSFDFQPFTTTQYVILYSNSGRFIGVGFGEEMFNLLHCMPGWYPGSWGYHGDDGCSFNESGSGKGYGPTFDEGDIIGCGVNFERETAFFTKNGEMLGRQDQLAIQYSPYLVSYYIL